MTEDILAKISAFILFGIVLLAIWLPSPEKLGVINKGGVKDLRIWSTLLISIQVMLYIFF